MKKLWILAGVILIGFLIYRNTSKPTENVMGESEQQEAINIDQNRNQQNTSIDIPAHELVGIQGNMDDDTFDLTLREKIETFIHLYYDWNYSGLSGLHLQDYVTHQFGYHVANDLADHAHVHDHDDGDEEFVMFEATAHIGDLEIYVQLEMAELENIEVIVTFDIFYDIPHQEPFSRSVITWLEVERDTWRVNNKLVMGTQ